jgi:hypothetical protein
MQLACAFFGGLALWALAVLHAAVTERRPKNTRTKLLR